MYSPSPNMSLYLSALCVCFCLHCLTKLWIKVPPQFQFLTWRTFLVQKKREKSDREGPSAVGGLLPYVFYSFYGQNRSSSMWWPFTTEGIRHHNHEIDPFISLLPIHTTLRISRLAITRRIDDISGNIGNC